MHRNEIKPAKDEAAVQQDGSSLPIVAQIRGPLLPVETLLDLKLLAEAVRSGVQDAIVTEDILIDYAELARRMNLKEKFVRQLKNAGIIHAALDLGKIVRFHWPSVLAELKAAKPGHKRYR